MPKERLPASTPGEQLSGTVESVSFHNDITHYTVCSVRIRTDADTLSGLRPEVATVVGTCAAIWVGEEIRAKGQWVRDPSYGLQFKAESMVCIEPTSAEGIQRYLASGMIRGIGKVNAARIVEKFGDRTLEIIDRDSKRLEEVEGIGPVRRKRIKESWVAQRAIRDIMIFLQSNGVGTAQSARIYRAYGSDAIALVKQNPYRLCRDIWGIGFKSADAIALRVGVPRESIERARAGLRHILQSQGDEGDCFGIEAELLLRANELLGISVERLSEALQAELEAHSLVKDGDRIYSAPMYYAERRVAHKIVRLLDTPSPFPPIPAQRAIDWAMSRMNIEPAPMQVRALQMAIDNKVSIITGGPGVGKTTIVRALVDIFGARRLDIRLAAPTGRASRRLGDATGGQAQTIHRLLKFNPQLGHFEHNAENPLKGDVFILDETSMVDLPLADQFLDALPDAAHLVLVGDVDQLPSVGPGNVLRDIIASGVVPCTRLDTIFRQKEGGFIIRNAHHVNNGERLELAGPGEKSDFFFVPCDNPDQVLARTIDFVAHRIPRKFGFAPLTDIQVLSPMRRSSLGCDNLNLLLQDALNPRGPGIQRFGRTYRVGDRVMQMRNNYDKDVFNGDIGFIRGVDTEDQTVAVDFDGRDVVYEFSELDELVHAYASSIHKSQGSEYPAVVIVLATQHYKLLQRNLLYTAITRGRRLVCIIGSHKAIGIAIKSNTIQERKTALGERLVGERNQPETRP